MINKREILVYCSDEHKELIIEELPFCLKRVDIDKDDTKLKLIPKDEVKSNLNRSPDFFDNLMMHMYFELKPDDESLEITIE